MSPIIVTGSVASGKTTLAKKLSKKLKFKYINVSKLIKEDKLFDSYDKKRKCVIVDIKKLNKFLIHHIIKKNRKIIIDSHLSHYLPKKYVDFCIVTKCNLKELNKRLKNRKYDKTKTRGNLDCEIFDVCFSEAKENKHKILVIDTTKGINISKIAKEINCKID